MLWPEAVSVAIWVACGVMVSDFEYKTLFRLDCA